jgi:hypothetical protein
MATPKMTAKGEKTKARTAAAASARSNTGTAGGAALFVALRKILHAHEGALVVARNESGNYELTTKTKGENGKPLFFGGVRTSRADTAFYLNPLASEPELQAMITDHLRAYFDGKSAFRFKTILPVAFAALEALTAAALERWKATGKL